MTERKSMLVLACAEQRMNRSGDCGAAAPVPAGQITARRIARAACRERSGSPAAWSSSHAVVFVRSDWLKAWRDRRLATLTEFRGVGLVAANKLSGEVSRSRGGPRQSGEDESSDRTDYGGSDAA
jgi:hypothetical protein